MKKTGVYTITNLINNKMIVGSGILNQRKSDHFSKLRKNIHKNPHLQASFNENGEENFVFEVIEECDHCLCINLEIYWINMLGTKNSDIGYNINCPLKISLGKKHSEETKKKMSLLGTNRKHTKETRIKMSNSQKGRIISQEHKEKISNKLKGAKNIWLIGKKQSNEHKNKILRARKNFKHSEESKKKIGTASKKLWELRKLSNFEITE